MKVVYDPRTDTLHHLQRRAPVPESDEDEPGIILDYDTEGNLLSLEILDASTSVSETRQIEFLMTS